MRSFKYPTLLPLLGWLNGIALALLGAGLGVA
ncbi:hypothetical protein BVI061214_02226 [Thermus aquaticus]|uniref:Uncharacterized protein n=1 Tax=Thermus aquaticus TaxID=271 RepID=A0A0M9AHL2_THEAQ|nr:hypothetical protein BVI061214_02226 [Thermus aquaticus]